MSQKNFCYIELKNKIFQVWDKVFESWLFVHMWWNSVYDINKPLEKIYIKRGGFFRLYTEKIIIKISISHWDSSLQFNLIFIFISTYLYLPQEGLLKEDHVLVGWIINSTWKWSIFFILDFLSHISHV